ncbi:hypothetical protein Pelo_18962 [Pelomyxa schiedti]|nr:hypothetical protein Pelo_18962 [Pelomyxa schiedti]
MRKPVIVGKRLQGDMVVEGYKNSYRVGFTLHCDHGLLDYYLNGRLQMRIPYGQCVELRGKPLFPAFSASMSTNSEQAISYVDIEF